MTLTRTIRRREKRKRAKAADAERAAMSPEDRGRLHSFSDMSDECVRLIAGRLTRDLEALKFASGDRW